MAYDRSSLVVSSRSSGWSMYTSRRTENREEHRYPISKSVFRDRSEQLKPGSFWIVRPRRSDPNGWITNASVSRRTVLAPARAARTAVSARGDPPRRALFHPLDRDRSARQPAHRVLDRHIQDLAPRQVPICVFTIAAGGGHVGPRPGQRPVDPFDPISVYRSNLDPVPRRMTIRSAATRLAGF